MFVLVTNPPVLDLGINSFREVVLASFGLNPPSGVGCEVFTNAPRSPLQPLMVKILQQVLEWAMKKEAT